jgi:hypothetical protein
VGAVEARRDSSWRDSWWRRWGGLAGWSVGEEGAEEQTLCSSLGLGFEMQTKVGGTRNEGGSTSTAACNKQQKSKHNLSQGKSKVVVDRSNAMIAVGFIYL